MKRFWKYRKTPVSAWKDWRWQLKNRLSHVSRLEDYFPNIGAEGAKEFSAYASRFALGITPHMLSLITLDEKSNPRADDPVWRQVRFFGRDAGAGECAYDGVRANWEVPRELPTRILHHKYPDRAIVRITNQCLGYCSFCYLTARVLDLKRKKSLGYSQDVWAETLQYLRNHHEIRDVLISGGDPLILDDEAIARILHDLSSIPSIKSLRLNTRALSFNPFRITKELVAVFKRYRLNALEIQTVHPIEITMEFDEALARFDAGGYRPQILWRSPLLRGINDSPEVLEDLLVKLYQRRIAPYYLFHAAPFTVARAFYVTGIKKGIEILLGLRRAVPGPAFPRYTLFHPGGKQDIPLETGGTPDFVFCRDSHGGPIVRFRNWRGKFVTYPDVRG